MKKLLRRAGCFFVAVLFLFFISLFLGLFAPRVFVAITQPIYKVAQFSAKQVGYEFRCYGIHGGFDCEFVKPLMMDDKVKQSDAVLMNQFRCNNDADCVLTDNGACGLKGIVPGQPSGGACVCANGPVISGCFVTGSPLLKSPAP
jgi:hypothetical protein